MSLPPDDPKTYILRVNAGKQGCGICRAELRVPAGRAPAGDPFPSGPYVGKYWCSDCWTLYYDENPEHLADADTRQYVEEVTKRIRLDRLRKGAEMIYEEGENRVFLTERGTVLFDIQGATPLQGMEFDPDRYAGLLKAMNAIKGKVPGYEAVPA